MFTSSRREWWKIGSLTLVVALLSLTTSRAETQVSLRDQLRSVLKARRDLEFEFIDRVAVLVDEAKLPKDLVLALMKYAVKKRANTPYPWFEQAIRIKANELGVDLDE